MTDPHSRIVRPGLTACDAFPRCDYEGKGDALADHMRMCPRSEVGDLYRVIASSSDVLAWGKPVRGKTS